jgi:hypothetical protein
MSRAASIAYWICVAIFCTGVALLGLGGAVDSAGGINAEDWLWWGGAVLMIDVFVIVLAAAAWSDLK